MKRTGNIWQRTGTQIGLGVMIAVFFIMAVESSSSYDDDCGWGWPESMTTVSGDRYKMRFSHGRCRYVVEAVGEVELELDNRGVHTIGHGGRLFVEERLSGERRRLEVRAVDGEPSYDYAVDGDATAFDDAARDWLADVLPRFQRATGFAATQRVAALFAASGLDAVLDEVAEVRGDRVQRLYLQALLGHIDGPVQVARVIETAAYRLTSDSELRRILVTLTATDLADGDLREAFRQAARGIASDSELRGLLEGLVEGGAQGEVIRTVLEIALSISSDSEQASLLLAIVKALPSGDALPEEFLHALDTIASDSETRRVLAAALERPVSGEETEALLEAARSIASDSETGELLLDFLATWPPERPLPEATFMALDTIASDSSQRHALVAAVRHPGIDETQVARLLQAALSLASDLEMSLFLHEVLEVHPEATALPEMETALATLSRHRRDELQAVLEKLDDAPVVSDDGDVPANDGDVPTDDEDVPEEGLRP